jgi:hypothetical protein
MLEWNVSITEKIGNSVDWYVASEHPSAYLVLPV